MKLVHILIYMGICYFTEAPDSEVISPWSVEGTQFKQSVEMSDMSPSFIQTPTTGEETTTTKRPKRKKSKRGKKKKMRQQYVVDDQPPPPVTTEKVVTLEQYVVDDQPPPPVTTEKVVTLEPIYEKSGNTYSQEELVKLCEETRSVGSKFGIHDVSSFAGKNCALIRLYYPDVTCEQINVFLQYCQVTRSIQ
ncbi:hypothetical protein COOONC_01220 [Cooperia oncophora]